MTPHFQSLNQDTVPWSQDEKCGLKYVIHILGASLDFRYYDLTKLQANPQAAVIVSLDSGCLM